MKFRPSLFAAALILAPFFAAYSGAHAQSQEQMVTVIDHVDIIPSSYKAGAEETAAKLLREQTSASLHDAGVVSYAVYQQNGIVETWRDQKAYEAHQGAAHTIKFRDAIQPLLGGPFDSRAHHPFQ
jgi:quinol monooxygenase YgiN